MEKLLDNKNSEGNYELGNVVYDRTGEVIGLVDEKIPTGEEVKAHKPDMRIVRKKATKLAEQENNTISHLAEITGLDKAVKSLVKEFNYDLESAKKRLRIILKGRNN